jgi:hypothetical protein
MLRLIAFACWKTELMKKRRLKQRSEMLSMEVPDHLDE